MPPSRPACLGLCAVASLCLSAAAQTSAPATLTGQIVDPAGAAVVGAHLEARQQIGSLDVRLTSDPQGRFNLANLPPGRYEIRVQHPGFRDLRQVADLEPGAALSLTLPLAVASLAQSVTVTGQSSLITESPSGQTRNTVSREDFKNTPATTIADVLALVPGVTFVQGNGPRDVALSVRGSNDRQTYGVRNVQVLEDGFPVTQPDGLARTDLTDPHTYSSIDVLQGPSSALFGNYATGGAINFHTRTGSEIAGLEIGADFGSFNYSNDFITFGTGTDHYQVAAFLSNVRADQATANNHFNTVTGNLLASFAVYPQRPLHPQVHQQRSRYRSFSPPFGRAVSPQPPPTRLQVSRHRRIRLRNSQRLHQRLQRSPAIPHRRSGWPWPIRSPHHRRRPLRARPHQHHHLAIPVRLR